MNKRIKIQLLALGLGLSIITSYAFIESDSSAATKCTGSKSCNACKNCKYCKHCAKDGGTCGVCK